jgi:hypothetical protein
MKQILTIFIIFLIVGLTSSCKKEFLQLDPLSDYSDAAVWNDPALIQTFVNNIYRNAMGWPYAIERLSDYSDESHFTPDWDVTNFNKSLMTSDGLMGWEVDWATPHTLHYRWAPLYSNVRACNIFFEKTEGVDYGDPAINAEVDKMKGEVHFLRAYTYHYLAALYGGVPIIDKTFGLSDEFEVARNSYEETMNFIVADIDAAVPLLPAVQEGNDAGRITSGAALHLKSRTLLYAASDLHHMQSSYAPGYSNPELLGYTGGSQATRWQAAKDAASAVMTHSGGMYGLVNDSPVAGDDIAQNFVDYFISYGYENEDILLQYFTPKTDEGWDGYNPALYCGPNGYHNWGNNAPLGELVDDYEMTDGSSFDWTNPAHKADPYTGREARFYATILYEGAGWRVRPSDVQGIDPWNKIQVGHVYDMSGTMIVPGVDTRSGPIEDWNGGKSGYYLRKFVDMTIDPQYVKQDIPFRHFRYAETLLNYAEACIELGGQDAEALATINLIRTRAGQPDITATGAALRDAYRHERRIEMAFEDQRFWDLRRWVIGPDAYHQTHAVDVRYETAQAATNYRQADGSTWGTPIFAEKELGGDARAWLDKIYFFPLMRDEMNKNTLLIQNPGY